MLQITYLTAWFESSWNAYVESHARGTPFHLTHWRDVIEQTFGHDPYYLMALEGRQVVGVLPLFRVSTRLFGSMMVSVPFAVYGGALANDEAATRALEQRAHDLAVELGVGYLELRDREATDDGATGERELYFTFRKPLPADPEHILPTIPRKTRRMVRLGIKGGLTGRLVHSGREVDAFYHLFARNLRKLGTPAFPKTLVENLLVAFGRAADLLLIEHEGRPAAGVVSFYFRDQVLPYYSGSDDGFNSLGINNFLYYDLMAKSVERGYRVFDFGRSKVDTGPYHFKRHFGFEPQPLPYRYRLVRATEPPNLNPTNPKYQRAIELWKKLPLRLTTAVGPWIVRGLP